MCFVAISSKNAIGRFLTHKHMNLICNLRQQFAFESVKIQFRCVYFKYHMIYEKKKNMLVIHFLIN